MTEVYRGQRNIKDVPPEHIPLSLLTKREREVLQHAADGHSPEETRQLMNISIKTVNAYRHGIDCIAIEGAYGFNLTNDYSNQARITILALIQDGITMGYLTHELPEKPVQPLTLRETKVLELASQGKIQTETAEEIYISPKTVASHMEHVRKKLHTCNIYQTVARFTYLKVHNMWPSPIES